MAIFRKVILGDAATAVKYFGKAEKMLGYLRSTGRIKDTWYNPEITIIAKIIGNIEQVIFIGPTLLVLAGLYRYPDGPRKEQKIVLLKLGTNSFTVLKDFFDIETYFPTSGFDLDFFLTLGSYITYDKDKIAIVREGTENQLDPFNLTKTTYDDWRANFSLSDDTAPYNLTATIDNGEVSISKTVTAQANSYGKYPLADTVTELRDQINAASPSGDNFVTSSGGTLSSILPLLSMTASATGNASVSVVTPDIPDELFPQTTPFGWIDREAVFSVKAKDFVDDQVFDWINTNQPWNPQTKFFPIGEHFTVDVCSEFVTKTNEYGYEKQIGKIVIWQKALDQATADFHSIKLGQYFKVNNGLTVPASPFNLSSVAPDIPDVVDSQFVSVANYQRTFFRYFNYAVGATPLRFYFPMFEHKMVDYLDASHVVIGTVMRDSPDTWATSMFYFLMRDNSDDGISRYYFCGFVHDFLGNYSGLWFFSYGYESGSDLVSKPQFIVYIADENGADNDFYGLINIHTIYATPELFSIYNMFNPISDEAINTAVNRFPQDDYGTFWMREELTPDNVCYIYGNRIIIITNAKTDSDRKTIIPTDVWAIDLTTGQTKSIWGKYPEGRVIRQISHSHEGRFIFLFDEVISSSAEGVWWVIDLMTDRVKRLIPPELGAFYVSFTQPIHDPNLRVVV